MSELDEADAEERTGDKRRWVLAAAAIVLLGAVLIWWRPWGSRSSCVDDDAHVVDSDAGLCYVVPEGWGPTDEAVLKEHGYTSGIEVSSPESTASVFVGPLDGLLDGSLSKEDDIEEVARQLAGGSARDATGDPELETETTTIDDQEAATARGTFTSDDLGVYVRVTVVELSEGTSVLISTALTGEGDRPAAVDEVHDSISAA